MQKWNNFLSVYASHHTKMITKVTHFIGIPCIIFAIQIILNWIYIALPSMHLSVAWVLVLFSFCYLLFDLIYGATTVLLLALITFLAQLIAGNTLSNEGLLISISIFIFGWLAQFIGHYYEGNRPAFMQNVLQNIVAPFFLVTELCALAGYKKD